MKKLRVAVVAVALTGLTGLTGLMGLMGLMGLTGPMGGVAAASPLRAPAPCVNREAKAWRQIVNVKIDGKSLGFCTGADCWTMDLGNNVFASAPAQAVKLGGDASGQLTNDAGAVIASATATHAKFCPAPSTCKEFDYKLAGSPISINLAMNPEGTLGAVSAHGETEAHAPSFVVLFDLTRGKLIKQLQGDTAEPLKTGFVIDGALYSGAGKKLAALAVKDQGWTRVATTDIVATYDNTKGAIVLQDGASGKVKGRATVGEKEVDFTLASTTDGSRVYAIGTAMHEGEVAIVDVATGKVAARVSPTACAANTRRVP